MNKKLINIALLLLMMPDCFAQDDFAKAYSSFSSESQQKYTDYSNAANRDFAEALKDNWKSFQVFDAKARTPKKPVTDTLARPCPDSNIQIDVTDVPVGYVPGKPGSRSTDAAGFFNFNSETIGTDSGFSFDFYGKKVVCKVPSRIASLRLHGSSEKTVGLFWEALSESGTGILTSSIGKAVNELKLNDWALFEWLVSLAGSVFPEECSDEKAVFTVFCMNQMGLCCKVARIGNGLLPIFASEQEVYGRKYVLIDDVKYYLSDRSGSSSSLSSYSVEMNGAKSKLDMSMSGHPEVGTGEGLSTSIASSVLGKTLNIPVGKSLISFYNDYPQLDVNMYAAAEPDAAFSEAVLRSIRPELEGRSGADAVNTILSFIQKDFRYRTDADQFGKEKPFFCEENFVYPYNDCEDRAVLFSFLARKLLNFDCILLEYSDHVNCALDIKAEIPQGYYVRRGERKYYICDPTCKGARIGMSGKDHQTKPQKIWVL